MPQEYYGYVERQDDSLVDWSKIVTGITNTLQQERDKREKQKAAIDEATNKSLNELANAPKGEAEDGNKFTVEYANDATQSMLLANRLLKAGKMSTKDYTLFMANINSGTAQLFNLQKEYQKWFDIKKQRMNSNDPANKSQRLEIDSNGYMEAFGDFSQSRAAIDPLTGRISIGITKKNPDGTIELTNKIMSVQDMSKSIGHQYNYFPSAQAAETITKPLGDIVMTAVKAGTISEKGEIIKYTDPLQREALISGAIKESKTQKALDEGIKSYLNIPLNTLSILTDDIGTYYNVFSEEDRKKDPKNAVLVKQDKYGLFSPELTEDQKKAAFDYMKTQAEAMIGQKVERDVFSPQAMEKAQYDLQKRKAEIDAKNAETARMNANKGSGKSSDVDEGIAWKNYVEKGVPTIEVGGKSDEAAISALTSAFRGLGLEFTNSGKGKEGIVIKDLDDKYPDDDAYTVILQGNPNARQQIVDYIVQKKASKAKNLIATDVIDKNDSGNTNTQVPNTSKYNND